MHIYKINKISALAALILFIFCHEIRAGLPLTETIYTIPESGMEISAREEILKLDNNFRRETYSVGLGVMPNLSVWYSMQYLHDKTINASSNKSGDSFLKVWLYLGDYFNSIHTGLLFSFRIPTGPNAYSEEKWRNASFGRNELKIGPVFKADINKSLFLHLNIFYVFRQGEDEGFYNGFYYNLRKKETYSKLFGLNFKSENTFLSGKRLKNDYAVFSMALNTDVLFPKISFIPFIEFYTSHRVYKKQNGEYKNIPIEGSGINPVFLSFGGRYFFSESIFLGAYYIFNPKKEKKFIKDIFGFDFSLQF
ncbi:MAG: hypothetical protein JXN64_13460 [Spirochaetes bacterium]|nr:hypothetical protein [Spirochaetota bacterium]